METLAAENQLPVWAAWHRPTDDNLQGPNSIMKLSDYANLSAYA